MRVWLGSPLAARRASGRPLLQRVLIKTVVLVYSLDPISVSQRPWSHSSSPHWYRLSRVIPRVDLGKRSDQGISLGWGVLLIPDRRVLLAPFTGNPFFNHPRCAP
ncbi:hypothetical protein MAPG_02111 [Magnaporthiopsis poae ATCC 64411]|uniref:Uncharacterized protein n=1 Tax=Magnaporthiopsis poae (strain ATCC 64411 / 73-15) TaxID=644358 RepID=A0A0C4DQH1_MAGP6|nr:hypothetical protein MAPG_02111 [Magnaporthiopsis poae ATCC 64411]